MSVSPEHESEVGSARRGGLLPPYRQSSADVVQALGTDAQRGLSERDAQLRLERDGANALTPEAPVPEWRKFVAQFTSVLVLLLIFAAAVSTVLWFVERESALPYEALAIMAVVLLNAIMGYVQESRAASAVAALRRMAAAQARVIRDGTRRGVPASELVRGDLIVIEEGDTIPADARLLQSISLHIGEAALTGESFPVLKDHVPVVDVSVLGDQRNMLFSGTTAGSGRGTAIVTETGMQTEMGRIAGMLKNAPDEPTPLQKELDRVGTVLGVVVTIVAVLMIGTIVVMEGIHDLSSFFDVLILGVALAVAAVPEGLPAVVTAVLALGVQRMAKRQAIVRHLAAVETLGSATVIASDKTGTLTRNEMTVRTMITASGRVHFGGTGYMPVGSVLADGGAPVEGALRIELRRALTAADRVNNATLHERDGRWLVQGDPTEGALMVAARKAGLLSPELELHFPRIGEIPFSSERKLMTTLHRDVNAGASLVAFTKGAPDVLLALCTHECVGETVIALTEIRRADIARANEALADEALRTLALATRTLPTGAVTAELLHPRTETNLSFLGLIGMLDPPRAEAKAAVATALTAGIRPIMITGDHPRTAVVIARELGIALNGRVATGAGLTDMSDEQLAVAVRDISVYARVNPEHKLRIVRALQQGGATVAMTGDGVNDAPALKSADIGIAMGITGTDVVKEVADVVLMDDNFATIVAAVEEGRAIFSNIRKFLRFLLSSNIGEVITMFAGVLFADALGLRSDGSGVVLPLLATQLLWINLVTDGAPALALGVDPVEPGLMLRLPRPRDEGVITPQMWRGIALVGVIMASGTLLVLDAALPGGLIAGSGTMRHAQTMAFTTLMMFQLFNVFNARSDERSALTGLLSNSWLWGAVSLSFLLQIAVIYVPFLQVAFSTENLNGADWVRCIVVASSVVWLRELTKLLRRRGLVTRSGSA